MRGLRLLAALGLCILLLQTQAFAIETSQELDAELDPEAGLSQELVEDLGPYNGSVEGLASGLMRLLRGSLGRVRKLGLEEGLRCLGTILAAALFCALLEDGPGEQRCGKLVGALTITAACTRQTGAMLELGTSMIRDLHSYVQGLLPGMTGLMAASGGLTASAALSTAGAVLFDLLLALVPGLLVPLLYLDLGLSVAECALGMENLAKLRELVKWLLVSLVKALMYGYSAVLSLTGLVSGSLDAQKLRQLRAALSGVVPVVGNIVSEASGSLLSAAQLLRSAAGLYGMLAVLGICLGPFLRIGLQYLLLKLATALCGLFGKGSQSPLLERLTQAMGILLALVGVCCLLSLMILVLCIRTVGP